MADKFDEINTIYSKLQKNISTVLFSNQKNKIEEIRKQSATSRDTAKKWADKYLGPEFDKTYTATENKLKRLKLEKKKDLSRDRLRKKRLSIFKTRLEYAHNSIMFFVQEFQSQFMKSEKFMRAQIQSYSTPVNFRRTELGRDVKKEIRKSLNIFKRYTKSGYLYRATLSEGEIERNLKKLFINKFGDIDFIAIPMKNGGFRRYQLKTYINMVARTEMRYINTQAAKLAMQEWGNDLTRVVPEFVGNCSSRICYDYAGKVFSLSGKDKEYPVLDEEPPFHPHCHHSLTPVTRETIALDKRRDAA